MDNITIKSKEDLISEIERRVDDKILERTNADLIIKLINNSDNLSEAIAIAQMGTKYKRTGFHFDSRFEKIEPAIKYFKKNKDLSFKDKNSKIINKLIIGDNYDALLNLLVEYQGRIDVIYIDPPYGKDSMGEFANTNYDNAITRDNLLSMLHPRLVLAKRLMSEDGIIFCSIDDKNLSYVVDLFNDIFEERNQLFVAPRQTKKGGKTTVTIQKNHDYIISYSKQPGVVFEKMNLDDSSYDMKDEYVEERGNYTLSQPLDYDSLAYSTSMDYPIEIDNVTLYPGGNYEKYLERQKGNHKRADWTWRWSKEKYEFGLENGFIVVKKGRDGNPRIYTKTYQYAKIEKVNDKYEIITKKGGKSYSTLTYLDNEYSNDNAKKELDSIFGDSSSVFKNPKPSELVAQLIKMVNSKSDAIILDFFAGSGTTGHSVLKLNEDGGNRTFILCTNNEITDINPNGIALDVTSKRLKRIMTGECYDGFNKFDWIKNYKPYGGNLDVYEIDSVANFESSTNKTPFDVIDETLYGLDKFNSVKDKIDWVCSNFEGTQKVIESDEDWKERLGKE